MHVLGSKLQKFSTAENTRYTVCNDLKQRSQCIDIKMQICHENVNMS